MEVSSNDWNTWTMIMGERVRYVGSYTSGVLGPRESPPQDSPGSIHDDMTRFTVFGIPNLNRTVWG